MDFYAALSVNRSSIRKIAKRLEEEYSSFDPLQNIIFTPITQGETSHQEIRRVAEKYDVNLMFDSGGYEVQTGHFEFDDLYEYLIDYYSDNQWASRYVLPDNVPVSGDSPEVVEQKVTETLSASRSCFKRLPEFVQENAVGVIQGHTREQISRCVNEYSEFENLKHLGFGSFATSGGQNSVNMLTSESLQNLRWAVKLAKEHGFTIHAFGIGGPTSIPLLEEAGVDSFDTSSWMKSSGYGNVFFPFKSRYNASHRTLRSGKVLMADNLEDLKEETNHDCPFCRDVAKLREDRLTRVMHNLVVTHELSNRVSGMARDQMAGQMDTNSMYRRRLETM
ncbi:hypothetical protein [Haloprofundus halophilus]|uniref:hypothetical protein n=1 Tax=Haloprofundus halophilus TaxID=2283527 RepID=UPI000E43E495|nr:hypothetical protein [Haloprofundus halophilus]